MTNLIGIENIKKCVGFVLDITADVQSFKTAMSINEVAQDGIELAKIIKAA